MFRFFILGIIVSNTVLGQSVECCPSEPKVQTGRYAIKPNCSVKFFGNWGSSGSSSVQLTGFDVSHDSSFNSFIRLNAGTIRTFFTTSTAFSDSTKYYRAFAKNRTHIAYGDVLEINPMDFNGNSYQAVAIGSQTWLVENLKSTFYQNGDSIHKALTNTEWLSPAPCDTVRIGNPPDLGQYTPVNGDFSNTELYGLLYNWWVAFDNRNPCPCGFRPPTQLDFQILVNEVGSNSGHLKDTTYWNLPNTGANNSTGFSALPSGYRLQWNLDLSTGCYTSTFIGGTSTVFDMWSSTEGNDNRNGLRLGMNHNSTGIFIGEQRKIGGRAIRCIEE